MALPRISKTHQNHWKSIKPINPNEFFSLIFTKNHTPSSNLPRPICTKSLDDPSLPSEVAHIADGLISIFTKQPFSQDNPELKIFASRLTTKEVESVLNGLKSWKVAHSFFNWASNQGGYKHNCYTYNAMASHLSHARQNAPMKSLAMEIVNSNCSMTPGALGFFIRCLGSLELVEEANMLFDQVRTKRLCVPNSYSYNCLLEAISMSGSIELLEKRLKEMRDSGWEFDKYTLTPVLKIYCNAGKFKEALNVYTEMHEKRWVDSHAMSILVLAFSKWGEVDKAFDLIERMEDHKLGLNEKTFHVLIHGFVRGSRVDKALQLFDKMRKSGFSVDVSLYDVLIGGLCKNREIEKALSMYSEMKELGIRSDVGVLTKLILSCSDQGEMIRILVEGQEDFNEEGMLLLYTSVLNGLVNNGSVDKAYQLVQAMKELGIRSDVGVLTKLILSCSDQGEMIRILVEGQEDFNEEEMVLLYTSVLNGLVNNGSVDKAYQLLQAMMGEDSDSDPVVDKLQPVEKKVRPTNPLFEIVIDGLLKIGKLDAALILFKDMMRSGCKPNVLIYSNLIDELCKSNRLEESYKLLREMEQSGIEPTQFTHNSIFGCLCRREDVQGALNLVKEMRVFGHEPWIKYSTLLVKQLCEHGKADEACNFLDNMVEESFLPNIVSYSAVMSGLFKIQEVDRALQLFRDISAHGYCPDVVFYNIAINGLCKAKRVSEAENLLNEMVMKGLVPSVVTYNLLINGWCKNGDVDKAMTCLSRIVGEAREPNVITYTTLIGGLCNAGRIDDALMIWNNMAKIGCAPNIITFNTLVTGLCKCGRPAEAVVYLREMEEKEMKPAIPVYSAVMSALISKLNLPRAT